jgi:hypothetical protein
MWIYVICRRCGKCVERLAVRSELDAAIPIEMDDGQVAAELLLGTCVRCRIEARELIAALDQPGGDWSVSGE